MTAPSSLKPRLNAVIDGATAAERIVGVVVTLDPTLLSEGIDWQVLDKSPGGRYQGRTEIIDRFFPGVKVRFASFETRPDCFLAEGDTVAATDTYRSMVCRDGRRSPLRPCLDGSGRGDRGFRQIDDTAVIATTPG